MPTTLTEREIPYITAHAQARAKERLGWNSGALARMAFKALNEGVTHAQTRGRLNRYLSKLYLSHEKGNNNRIYGEHVYIFHGDSLITVIHLPREMRAAARDASHRGCLKT